jgi:hypothetical protein
MKSKIFMFIICMLLIVSTPLVIASSCHSGAGGGGGGGGKGSGGGRKASKSDKSGDFKSYTVYICPMEDSLSSRPRKCSKCGMKLNKAKMIEKYECPYGHESNKSGRCKKDNLRLNKRLVIKKD